MAAFEIIPCLRETCDGIEYVDATGFFGTSNPWGYNAPQPSVPTLATNGTFGYTSYTLSIWAATAGGYDSSQAPLITVDLLTTAHTIDVTTGHVTWAFTFEQLGLSGPNVRSGWWYIRLDPVVWTSGGTDYDYSTDQQFAFVQEVTKLRNDAIIASLRKHGFKCDACKCGGISIGQMNQRFLIIRDFAPCVGMDEEFTKGIDWLYSILPLCNTGC